MERLSLTDSGRKWDEIKRDLQLLKEGDYDWRGGRIPLYVYYDNEELYNVTKDAYNLFFSENSLGRKAFPSVVQMESDVIDMALSLFNAPPGAGGCFTAGGTESNFLVVKAAREHARSKRPEITRPKIVVSRTCHPSIDKAAYYLGLDVVRIPSKEDFTSDIEAIRRAIDDNTIMIVGSAPGYSHGVFDPITELGQLAKEKDVWLHVDSCLGGFLAPFVRDIGYAIREFDLAVPGVTSLSADVHKYGMSAKGASVILYRDAKLKEHQRFEMNDWPRGVYATDTFLGSRGSGSVASAWAVMHYLGRDGYRKLATNIMDTKERLIHGIEAIEGLEIVRPSELCMLLYRSVDPALDTNAIADNLGKKGWFVARAVEPVAIHLALNPVHANSVDAYIGDLMAAVSDARSSAAVGAMDAHTY